MWCCCCSRNRVTDENSTEKIDDLSIKEKIRGRDRQETERTTPSRDEQHTSRVDSEVVPSYERSAYNALMRQRSDREGRGILATTSGAQSSESTHSTVIHPLESFVRQAAADPGPGLCSATRCAQQCSPPTLSRTNSTTSSVIAIRNKTRPRYYTNASEATISSRTPASPLSSSRTESIGLSTAASPVSEKMRRELLGFGLASDGQLGMRPQGDQTSFSVPEHVFGAPTCEGGASVHQIACGEKHTVILAEDGKMWSVGTNESGQLGRGSRGAGSYTIYPVNFSAGAKVIQVACGREHCICVTDDGRLFAWGSNSSGQLGMPASVQFLDSPKRVTCMNEVVQVACGPEHSIALTESGRVYVFGLQYDGACFHNPTEIIQFIGIPIVRGMLTVAAGGRHCVALSASGSVFTWGQNDYGQLGTGDTTRRATPIRLENVSNMKVVDVVCGDAHTILLTREGRLFAFGSDQFGQLGCGRRLDKHTMPVVVSDLMGSQVTRVAAGRCHTVAVVGGKMYSFGLNSNGQLGNGSIRNQITPRVVDELDHVSTVFSGWDQSFIVRSAGVPDVLSGPCGPPRTPRFLNKAFVLGSLKRNEKLDLIGELESVFSSLSTVNGSFLYDDERRFSISDKNHGVNLDDVMDTFNALALTGDAKQYADLVIETLSMSFFSSDFEPKQFLSDECLRPFLILPWLNAFVLALDKETVLQLHVPFSVAFATLKSQQAAVLEKWWRALPMRHFNRVVTALVAGVNRLITAGVCPSKSTHLLNVLAKLNDINRKENKIPLENFYVNELSEKVDIKMDYLKWATRDQHQAQNQFFWSNYPFIMNGAAKGELLHVEARLRMQQMVSNSAVSFLGFNVYVEQPYFDVSVRREHIVHDTITSLMTVEPHYLQKPLRVQFIGEEGEDAGGVKKEFFMILFQKLLQPEYGMFVEDPDSHLVWFSGAEIEQGHWQMVGALCGLAVYNGVLVNFPFPSALYKNILKQPITLEDFAELHPVEAKGLQSLLDYEGDDMEDVFSLTFEITHTVWGHSTTIELKPHGKEMEVNQRTKHEYVKLYVKSRMEEGVDGNIKNQLGYFKQGFSAVITSRIIDFFQPRELMELVVGNENYDWSEFKNVVEYKGEYHAKHPTILAFWDAFFELTVDERKKFLQFLMGSTRLPVQGMKALKAFIQPCASHSLPVAHTCFNLLDLPNLADKKELVRRLRISIEHQEGFTLV